MGAAGHHGDLDQPEWRIAALMARLDRDRRTAEQHAHLGMADGRLLWLFSDRRPRTLREIAEDLNLEQSTVNRQVNAALKAGLLQRDRPPGQPALLISATEVGLARFEEDLSLHLGIFRQSLAALDDDERPHFLDQLRRFVDAYSQQVAEQVAEQVQERVSAVPG